MTPKAVDMYTSDTSGIDSKPLKDSQVAFHNRIDHLTHASFHKHLLSDGLHMFYQQFATALIRRLSPLNIHEEWTAFPDMMRFWMDPLTASMNEALAGKVFECLKSEFYKGLTEIFSLQSRHDEGPTTMVHARSLSPKG